MHSLESTVDQMKQLLSELIQVATQLRDMSLQVISEEDLISVQKQQEQLLSELEKTDRHLHQEYRNQVHGATRDSFQEQLQLFQSLNQEFIQNLDNSHGLIQFEFRQSSEEEKENFVQQPKNTRSSKVK